MLVVLQVLCMLIWPWPNPRSRSRSPGFWSSENCQKLHFPRSVFSAISAWSSKVMVDHDSTRPILQLVGAWFSNFLLRKLSYEFKIAECHHHTSFKWLYFCIAWNLSHTVGRAGSPTGIVHVDVTLTWSKVTLISQFLQIALFYVYLLCHFGVELKTDG